METLARNGLTEKACFQAQHVLRNKFGGQISYFSKIFATNSSTKAFVLWKYFPSLDVAFVRINNKVA